MWLDRQIVVDGLDDEWEGLKVYIDKANVGTIFAVNITDIPTRSCRRGNSIEHRKK